MNKVILMGRLTRDPEVRYSQGENSTAIARYTLAVDRRFRRNNDGEQTADFIGCVAFGRSAEFAEKYFRQGLKVIVTGRIQTGSYTNKEGQKVYTTDVVVEDQEFAESKAVSDANAGSFRAAAPSPAPASNDGGYNGGGYNSAPARPQPAAATDGFMNIPDGIDEELPFN
jgi:single-strand DNA-binding protein